MGILPLTADQTILVTVLYWCCSIQCSWVWKWEEFQHPLCMSWMRQVILYIHIHVQEYFYMYFLITSWQSISNFLWLNSATWIRRYLDIVETEPFNQCTVDGSEIRRSPVEVGSLSHDLRGVLAPYRDGFLAGFLNHQQYHQSVWKPPKFASKQAFCISLEAFFRERTLMTRESSLKRPGWRTLGSLNSLRSMCCTHPLELTMEYVHVQ